jgi:hypothetical protein
MFERKTAMKSLNDYTIILRPDENGTFVAYIPAIKGCQKGSHARFYLIALKCSKN